MPGGHAWNATDIVWGFTRKARMPLTLEYRLFFLDGRLLLCAEYWEEGDYRCEGPPVERPWPQK